jgi:hypothetical protein
MKKNAKKPLRLATETIRILGHDKLVQVAGGASDSCDRSSTEKEQSCGGSCLGTG